MNFTLHTTIYNKNKMKPLYTESEYQAARASDKLPCKCEQCGDTFYKDKRFISRILAGHQQGGLNYINHGRFCSIKCYNTYQTVKVIVTCGQCGATFERIQSQVDKSKHHFCSKSCAGTYTNTHKTKGNRRSKLEKYLEETLQTIYPELEIHYNRKDIINSELDIYIPSLKLAFELNGIFHYEPIYGANKLNQIQNNDTRKFQACLERGIEMCTIDTSGDKYFKADKAVKYLNIIESIIKQKRLVAQPLV